MCCGTAATGGPRPWHSLLSHGIIAVMKSFLVILSLLIAVSLACSASKSAGSQALPNNGTPAQPSTPTNNAPAQEKQPCTLTLAGAPAINGLHLGLTPDEILAMFPGSKEDPEVRTNLSRPPRQFGVSSFLIRPAKYQSTDKFSGIGQITFTLLDGRVSSFYLGYNGPQYSHVDQFVEKLIAGSKFPPLNQWEGYVGMDTTLKELKCSEFEIKVSIGGPGGNLNYVSMKDLVAEKVLKDRRAKANAQVTPTPGQ